MSIDYLTFTACGRSRTNNEDCFKAVPESGFFMVADGMGGHLAGEVASNLAVEAVAKHLLQREWASPRQGLLEAIAYANSQIFSDAQSRDEHCNMGSTMALAWQQQDLMYIAHVGDSRVYVFNSEQARRLTQDHSVVGELLRDGLISEEEAINHPEKNVLNRALGVEEHVQAEVGAFELPIPGFLLLCTDGLSGYLPLQTVLPQVAAKVEREQILPVLAELAKEAGSNDDITCMLLWETGEEGADE